MVNRMNRIARLDKRKSCANMPSNEPNVGSAARHASAQEHTGTAPRQVARLGVTAVCKSFRLSTRRRLLPRVHMALEKRPLTNECFPAQENITSSPTPTVRS